MDRSGLSIRTVLAVVSTLAIASSVIACGGGGSASTAPGASTAATPRPAASAGAPSEAAATAAPSTAGGGGGGGATGVACDLLTADQASGVVGGGPYTTASVPGEPSYCTYTASDGNPKVITSYVKANAKAGYDAWLGASDTVKISGIGDGALWVPSLATLLILKGDHVFGITAGSGSDDETQRMDWSKAIGAIVAAKM